MAHTEASWSPWRRSRRPRRSGSGSRGPGCGPPRCRPGQSGWSERAQAERRRHESVDVVFEAVDRDGEVGGGIIAGALAYRFFIWLLPLALVAVAGLGFAAESAHESPEETADSVGLSGLVSGSIAGAAESPNRWYALLVGIPILLWSTRSLLRALIGAHRLVWTDLRAAAPRPTVAATVTLLALLLCFFLVSVVASAVRAWSGGAGVVTTLLVPCRTPESGCSSRFACRIGSPLEGAASRRAPVRRGSRGAQRGGGLRHRAVGDQQAGDVRRPRRRRGLAPGAVLPVQADRRCSRPQRNAVGAPRPRVR